MMSKLMSLSARRELLVSVRHQYTAATWSEKKNILDGFVTVTGYGRKHAITLLMSPEKPKSAQKPRKRTPSVSG